MRAVLLGPNGQLGSDIVRAHAASGSGGTLLPLGRDQLPEITDREALGTVLRKQDFDVLINCTSYHKTDEVELNGTHAVAVNAHAVMDMAAVCAEKRARFVHISTDYVFGGDTAGDRPLTETDPPAPVNVYGASKLLGEALAQLTCADTLVLRVASLFGIAGASGKGGNFVETMIRVGKERGELRVVDDQTMSPTSTADIATTLLALVRLNAAPGLYHVVNSGSATWYEFARQIIDAAGVDARVIPITSAEFAMAAKRPSYSALDNKKVGSICGPLPDWKDALQRYLLSKGHRPAAT